MKKVVVVGLGYIGLPTACLIASNKIEVLGVDVNPKVINLAKKGKINLNEPDLIGLFKDVVEEGYLKVSLTPNYADVFIVCVPTPFKDGHKSDLSYVMAAINSILPYIEEDNLIIIESTCPVGTTENIRDLVFSKISNSIIKGKIYLAYCSERVIPGKILYELIYNDRIIGGINEVSSKRAKDFYNLFVKSNLYDTNSKTAEMCKLVENSYRDVNIAFANEISIICDKLGINTNELIKLANKHPRVNILKPGCGVGGHCIAVDPWFIVEKTPDLARLIKTSREVNLNKTEWVIKKIKKKAKEFEEENKSKPKIAILGLTYKPNVSDLRESPALNITKSLAQDRYPLYIIEPNILRLPKSLGIYKNVKKVELNILNKVDIIVLLVPHKEFKKINKSLIDKKIVIDMVGILLTRKAEYHRPTRG